MLNVNMESYPRKGGGREAGLRGKERLCFCRIGRCFQVTEGGAGIREKEPAYTKRGIMVSLGNYR